jgi:TolA-binding protein
MTEERDPRISQRYRSLASEEPSRELDQAILSAAHRAADRPHAPLVTPAGRHRWYFAFGAAAILVLAVAVTVQVERQQPDVEALQEGFLSNKEQHQEDKRAEPAKQVEPPQPLSDAPQPRARVARKEQAQPAPAASPPAEVRPQPSLEVQSTPAPAPAPEKREQSAAVIDMTSPPPGTAPEADRRARADMQPPEVQRRAEPQAAPAPRTSILQGRVAASAAPESPERVLERIAELRKEGHHDEADKLLAEFRQRYPDYRISEEMLQKVERKK